MTLALQVKNRDGSWSTLNTTSGDVNRKMTMWLELLEVRDSWTLSGLYLNDTFRVKEVKP